MRHWTVTRRGRRPGAIAVLLVVALGVIVGIAALSLDGGRMFCLRRQAQLAADAAAMAAAIDLYNGELHGEDQTAAAQQSALLAAAENGFADGDHSQIVVRIPPTSGEYAGQDGYVEVQIESEITRGFSRVFGGDDLKIKARAVAAGTLSPTKASVLILDPKQKKVLHLSKGGTLLETQGDVIVNSINRKSAEIGGGASLIAENVIFAGSLDKKVMRNLSDRVRGEIHQCADPTPDPLAQLMPPEAGIPRQLSDQVVRENGKNIYHLQPGIYREPLKFGASDIVTLTPGVYRLEGGMSLKEGAVFTANEVTLYVAPKKQLKFESTELTLSAPTNGPYSGVAIFCDRTGKGKLEFKKDGRYDISGIIYAPNSDVKFKDVDVELTAIETSSERDSEEEDELNDGTVAEGWYAASMGASIIARRLFVAKRSHLYLSGKDIDARLPQLRLVE